MRAPDFWASGKGGARAALLAPLGFLYGRAAKVRQALASPWRAPVPVICVGNLVAGGAGKTPVALALMEKLKKEGVRAHFLSRGYGGAAGGTVRV
ncbi:MAG TPA: tetraacyldisaccharide 4'-kinase, partial [Rhodospirillales bacterium]|nr:tetraacyldisaccharide 4'-kinase [Rhodospirillales bacterium]